LLDQDQLACAMDQTFKITCKNQQPSTLYTQGQAKASCHIECSRILTIYM